MKGLWSSVNQSYSYRSDVTNEKIDTISSSSRLAAAKYFASRKQLSLKEFLKIFKINK